jgi:hypothetical protein
MPIQTVGAQQGLHLEDKDEAQISERREKDILVQPVQAASR